MTVTLGYIRIVILKPGLFWHQFTWNPNKNEFSTQTKSYLLPEITTKIEIKKSEKITLKYNLVPQFSQAQQVANRYVLSNFNSIYQGNSNLENNLTHQASATYYKFNLYRGIFINGGVFYRNKVKNIQTTIQQVGINQVNTNIQTHNPDKTWTLYGSFAKTINTFKYTIDSRYSTHKNTQQINTAFQENNSKNTSVGVTIKTLFEDKYPNFIINQEHLYRNFITTNNTSKFINKETSIEVDYQFLKDFQFNADYSYTDYRNHEETTKNYFNTANASLFYQKEDSPWGFELTATNVFDAKFKNQNSFSDFVVSDTQTFILPRILMLKIAYKL